MTEFKKIKITKNFKWNKNYKKRKLQNLQNEMKNYKKNYKMKIEIMKITWNMIILYQNARKKTLTELKVNEDNSEKDSIQVQ